MSSVPLQAGSQELKLLVLNFNFGMQFFVGYVMNPVTNELSGLLNEVVLTSQSLGSQYGWSVNKAH